MDTLFLDTEVRGPDLNQVGLGAYATDPSTRLLLFTYALNDEPVKLWDVYHRPTGPPPDLVQHLNNPTIRLVAHSAMFDRVVLMHKANLRVPYERWYCTEARANIHGLPGGLDKLSRIFKLGDDSKMKAEGEELIKLFCKTFADPSQHPVEWAKFCQYAIYDVVSMRRLYHLMPEWCFDETEQRVYWLDQKINDRGFHVDLDLAQRMIEADKYAEDRLNERVQALTDGAIQKATQRAKVKDHLNAPTEIVPGCNVVDPGQLFLDDMRAETLNRKLRDHKAGRLNLTPEQKELIELRLLTAKSSVAKCRRALRSANSDSRIRYTMKYSGGGRIGRYSHKGFQPGNMPRPDPEHKKHIPAAIEALKGGYMIDIWGDESRVMCANCIRGVISAAPGHKLIASDWSNIEGRMLAWYADEEWKLQMYRDKDAGVGEDGYKILWHRMSGTPIDQIDDFLRQQGKGADLSMGYEGGVGAFLNIANSYKIDLVALAKAAPHQVKPEFMARGEADWKRDGEEANPHGLTKEIYVACAALKHSYRDANPEIKSLWRALLDCAMAAVNNPGKVFATAQGKVHMRASPDWLAVQIPSGRKIMFAKPRIRNRVVRNKDGEPVGTRPELTALKSPTWFRAGVYGGLIANAITQGGCRDILVQALLRVDADGFPIILHVHDEIIAEVPVNDPHHTLQRLIDLMEVRESWFDGMPLVAAGYEADRIRKD